MSLQLKVNAHATAAITVAAVAADVDAALACFARFACIEAMLHALSHLRLSCQVQLVHVLVIMRHDSKMQSRTFLVP